MFQSTHPHGVRLRTGQNKTNPRRFNPRTRTGCDLNFVLFFHNLFCFNPRTRTGCDYCSFPDCTITSGFNPRTRTGCDLASRRHIVGVNCFNPRTRTGCDFQGLYRWCKIYVSIHAPARGATYCKTKFISHPGFQSTHPHGVRLQLPGLSRLLPVFQSTHPHGVRPPCSRRQTLDCCFNPRTRTGCDQRMLPIAINELSFNPRTRTGCDLMLPDSVLDMYVSIHAPARGATITLPPVKLDKSVSIHAPARGATVISKLSVFVAFGFNPRTRTGCDLVRLVPVKGLKVSIHAPARGATPGGTTFF